MLICELTWDVHSVVWALVLLLACRSMHLVFLDEFGHIGPFVSRDHQNYNTSPVFAGFFLHERQVREFATWFYKLKNDFFKSEIESSTKHAATWEKKGHEIFTGGYVYRNKRLGYSLINTVKKFGGKIIFPWN
jgi:hypothetical protein